VRGLLWWMLGRPWSASLVLVALVACQGGVDAAQGRAADPVVAFPPAALATLHFKAVLVAGDSAQPVFDNATHYLHDRLLAAGVSEANIHRLSSADHPGSAVQAASLASVTAGIAGLASAPGEGCLVFLTSHGHPRYGLALARSREFLTPARLDQALAAGCAGVPTIVIVSSCYSGGFARPPMARPNRIILTAARPDRPSFGCAAGFTYNIFDECLLASLDGAATWQIIYERARSCVATRESAMGERPSEPQAYFGRALANMPAPWRRITGAKRPDSLPERTPASRPG
jgi:hypothetical protein